MQITTKNKEDAATDMYEFMLKYHNLINLRINLIILNIYKMFLKRKYWYANNS